MLIEHSGAVARAPRFDTPTLTPQELDLLLNKPNLIAYLETQPAAVILSILHATLVDSTLYAMLACKLAEERFFMNLSLQLNGAWQEITAQELSNQE